jgi:uncharacterized protein (TIRG00374 family)
MERTTSSIWTILRAGVGIVLLVYLTVSGAINWSALLSLATDLPITLAALLLLLVDLGISAFRLCVLLRPRGFHLSLLSSVRLTLIGMFFNACLPGSAGGEVMRIYYGAGGNGGRRTEIATIMLLDRVAGMFALVLWPVLVIPLFPQMVGSIKILPSLLVGAGAVAAVMLAAMLICSSIRVRNSLLVSWTLRKLPLGSYLERILVTIHAYRENAGTMLTAVGISLLAHTMSIGVMLLLAVVTNPSGAEWEMAMLIPLGMLANMLPLTPGGLGIGEAAFNKLFLLAGLTGGAEVLLGWRVLTILVGLLGLVFYLQGRKRIVHESPPSNVLLQQQNLEA